MVYVKVTISALQSLTQDKKFVEKIRAGGEIGETFLLIKNFWLYGILFQVMALDEF